VAWIDCLAKGDKLGRSVLFLGEHERRLDGERETHNRKKSLSVPFSAPSFFMQSSFVRFFNAMYFASHKKAKTDVVGYETFFYPLDRILHWNRIYGRWGFSQYQLVLPKENSKKGLQKILSKIADSGQGSFLAVLKLFGKQDSFLSFPMEGFTLALDFPVKPLTLSLMNELDELVLEYGGRLYLGKDARMSAGMFAKSYSHAQRFREVKRRVDPDAKFASLQSRRLEI
jgi:FAD/FMN-containing dehydrogenase